MIFMKQMLNELCDRYGWPKLEEDDQGIFHLVLDDQPISIVRNSGKYRVKVECLQLTDEVEKKQLEIEKLFRYLSQTESPIIYGMQYNEQNSLVTLYSDIEEHVSGLNDFEQLLESLLALGGQLKQHCQPKYETQGQPIGSHFIRL